jgi:3-oxoacyl-[acyl-carrier-protein] synthase-3
VQRSTRGRDVSVLFGDGAGAVVVQGTDDSERGIIEVELHTQGEFRDLLKMEFPSMRQRPFVTTKNVEDGAIYPRMDGRHVFKHAARRMPEVVGSVLGKAQLSPDDVDLFVFHQANLRINEMVMKRLGQPMEKSFNNIDRYGNCSAASIPMCLAEARAAGRINDGDLVCMASFGAGYTWAGALLRW